MSSSSQPPRFVPTLTEVVQPAALAAVSVTETAADTSAAASAEVLVQCVMQRVDLVLERRLREAVGQLILEHTQTLAPRLREEIERVTRQSVSQAFEQELAQVKSPSPAKN